MTEAPERIWAFEPDIFDNCSLWQDQPSPKGDTIEYIRADLVEAAVKRALEGAADVAEVLDDPAPAIRALDPAQFVDGEKT